jgi:hypothetical protein
MHKKETFHESSFWMFGCATYAILFITLHVSWRPKTLIVFLWDTTWTIKLTSSLKNQHENWSLVSMWFSMKQWRKVFQWELLKG